MATNNRLGGWLLTVGALTLTAAIAVYVTQYEPPQGTGPDGSILPVDRVRHYLAYRSFLDSLWLAEWVGVLLIFAAGCFVQNSATAPGWRLARGGLFLLFVQYALMLYGYPAAAAQAVQGMGLFVLMNKLSWAFFLMGNGLMMLGFAAVFFRAATSRALPGLAARIAGTLALLGALSALAVLAGLRGTAIGGLFFALSAGLAAFSMLFMAAYGVGLSRTR